MSLLRVDEIVSSDGSSGPVFPNGVVGAFANPMDSTGDLIVGGVDGLPTKLDLGTNGQTLVIASGAVLWALLTNANIDAAAAIDGSKIVAATASVPGVVSTTTQSFTGDKTFNVSAAAPTPGIALASALALTSGQFVEWQAGDTTNVAASIGAAKTSSTTTRAGYFRLRRDNSSTFNYYWVDTTGQLRTSTTFSDVGGLGGSPVGAGGFSAPIVKTGAYNIVAGDRILADTTSTAFTLTLPSSPSVGAECEIWDAQITWETNNLTVARNGQLIDGSATDLVCNVSGYVHLMFVGGAKGWRVFV